MANQEDGVQKAANQQIYNTDRPLATRGNVVTISSDDDSHMNWATTAWAASSTVFIFLYFLFSFFTKIYFRFGNLQEYTPVAWGGRDLAARQRGGRGICEKNFREKIPRRSLGAGHPAAGRPAVIFTI